MSKDSDRPDFIAASVAFDNLVMRFNGTPVSLYRSAGDPRKIQGWTANPRVEMVLNRWRRAHHKSEAAFPDDDQMLQLMLDDDVTSRSITFAIRELGEDLKLNGVRAPIVVTWDGILLDGNRRKFAAVWALSKDGNPTPAERQLLENVPMLVLAKTASESDKQAILIQENYADSLKKPWPEVVTNRKLFQRFEALSEAHPGSSELDIRRDLKREFPRFGVTEIRNRIGTWELTEEFRADYTDELGEDQVERVVNERFQYFRQAHDTFVGSKYYPLPDWRQLLFLGIRHSLFPSFASIRELDDIFDSEAASAIFRAGEGMSDAQKKANFKLARDEAGRQRAESQLTAEQRILSIIEMLNGMRSDQLGKLSNETTRRLGEALVRVIAQAAASAQNPTASANEKGAASTKKKGAASRKKKGVASRKSRS